MEQGALERAVDWLWSSSALASATSGRQADFGGGGSAMNVHSPAGRLPSGPAPEFTAMVEDPDTRRRRQQTVHKSERARFVLATTLYAVVQCCGRPFASPGHVCSNPPVSANALEPSGLACQCAAAVHVAAAVLQSLRCVPRQQHVLTAEAAALAQLLHTLLQQRATDLPHVLIAFKLSGPQAAELC